MNQIHHVIWNDRTQTWTPVSEKTRAHSKKSSLVLMAGMTTTAFVTLPAYANCDVPAIPPTNATVTCTGSTSGTYTIRNVQNVKLR